MIIKIIIVFNVILLIDFVKFLIDFAIVIIVMTGFHHAHVLPLTSLDMCNFIGNIEIVPMVVIARFSS